MTDGSEAPLTEARVLGRLLAVARARPNDAAVSDLAQTQTFAQLMGTAAAIAEQIGCADSEPTSIIVLVDRSVASVAAVIGTIWSGTTLIPLDVNEPSDRIAEIARRCSATRVIDATGLSSFSAPDISTERASEDVLEPEHWPAPARLPADRRSVILFTSGSTGQAKGVVRTVADLNEYLTLSEASGQFFAPIRTAVLLPLHFLAGLNAGVFALSTGRFTVMVDPMRPSLDEVLRRLVDADVEQFLLPVSLLRAIAAHEPTAGRWRSVQHIVTMGEALYGADVRQAAVAFGPSVSVTTVYGSTEGNGFFGSFTVMTGDELTADALPVGKPIAPAAVRLDFSGVSDEQREDGIGELIFRGALASGYLDDPVLQAERFGTDPDGVRTWRGGDLATLAEDGTIRLRGRSDDVIKINGKLVDPSEPERVLRDTPGIRAAIVLPQSFGNGRARLVAHVQTDGAVSATAVREQLRRRLPVHLVPALLIRHDSLPVTDRGKPDRSALRAVPLFPWRDEAPSAVEHRVGPAVLALVARILELPELSADDVLWDVGCDSLAAVEIATALASTVCSSLEPNDLITARTVREICTRIEQSGLQRSSFVVALNNHGTRLPIFMVPGAGSIALAVRTLSELLGEDQPFVVLEQYGLHSGRRPDRSVNRMVRRNLRAVRQRQAVGPYVIVGRSFGGVVAHEMVRRLVASGERAALVMLDTHRNVAQGVQRPDRLRQRVDSRPVFAAKWLVWRLVRAKRQGMIRARDRFARLGSVGSMQRYEAFGAIATRALRRDTRPVLDAPFWYLYPAGSTEVDAWRDHPRLVTAETGGDHYTMINPPNTVIVAAAVRAAAAAVGHPAGSE